MERKIGEIFKYNGEWYQCIVGCHCPDCAFCNNNCEERERITLGNKLTKEETTGFCTPEFREDGKSVIFKKLEKVGEPYSDYCPSGRAIYFQRYKCYQKPIIEEDIIWHWADDTLIDLEIKQNKEDMEEKKQKLDKLVDDYMACRIQYAELDKEIKALYDKEESEPTLKEFDIEADKSGKPVCTRDGRKARIICFDTKGNPCPIIALVEENGIEAAYHYDENGQNAYNKSELDLMMLPGKKEGWVNVYKGGLLDTKSYNTKKEAFDKASPEDYVDTVKINWEE